MLIRVIHFVRLPLFLIALYSIARFSLGLIGVPYAPRGNAMFSVVGVMLISSFYFGALSASIGEFKWGGTILIGIVICFAGELLILLATLISYLGNLDTYFIHWDALNVPAGTSVPFGKAIMSRVGGLIAGPILGTIVACLGRAFRGLAPRRELFFNS
jgi:hypothetical protein